jgi:hypothetical protein
MDVPSSDKDTPSALDAPNDGQGTNAHKPVRIPSIIVGSLHWPLSHLPSSICCGLSHWWSRARSMQRGLISQRGSMDR